MNDDKRSARCLLQCRRQNESPSCCCDPSRSVNCIKTELQSSQDDSLAFRLFDRKEKTMRQLSKESASFMWSQFLIDVLKKFPVDKDTYEEMLLVCEECYQKFEHELQKIKEFRECEPRDAIQWYSKNSFLYRLLNLALRTEDIDNLYTFRGYIIDLCSAIEWKQDQQRQQPDLFSRSNKCYRGQIMFESEFHRIKESIGQLVSVNSFFSASLDRKIAEVFAGSDLPNGQRSIVVEIDFSFDLLHTTFAFIEDESDHPDEKEVLFNLCTVFKVENVHEDQTYGYIHLQATDEGYEVFKEYRQFTKSDIESPTIEIIFGRLLMNMGQYDKALKHFELLASKSSNDYTINCAAIHMQKGTLYYHICKYEEARNSLKVAFEIFDRIGISTSDPLYLRCCYYIANVCLFTNKLLAARTIFEKVLERQRNTLSKDHVHIGDTLRSMAKLVGNEKGYHATLSYRQEALAIYEKTLPAYHPKRINALHDLSGCYEAVGEYRKALDILYQAVSLIDHCVTEDHSSRAKVLRTIGINKQALGNWEEALDYYSIAYSIWMAQFPQGHSFTAYCLSRIGEIYRYRKQFREALDCQLHSLAMRSSLFPPNTPQPCHSLGLTYLDMGDNKKAIETLKFAQRYWHIMSNDRENIFLNFVESCLATAYSHNGELELAHETFEKVLHFQQNSHPEGNPNIGVTLHHMASNLKRLGKYKQALQCYQDSLDMLAKFFNNDHFEVVIVREKMLALEFTLNN